MKKLYIISIIALVTFIGCSTTKKDEWDVKPEYIDYNISETNLVALYNAYNAQPLNIINYAEFKKKL
jgi:hypothetical protein